MKHVKNDVYFLNTLRHISLMPGKKGSSTRPKSKRDIASFRILPETKRMLDRAVAKTDTTLGRYIEKALRAQFKKDGIEETE